MKSGMKRYRQRSAAQAELVVPDGDGPLDLAELFAPLPTAAPLRLEIGCGHGEFISQMAAAHPAERFLGIEHDRLRITKIAHKCLALSAENVRLAQGEAHALVRFRLPPASCQRVYILFPDPWPKLAHRRRRLLNRSFLLDLSHAVAPGGRLVIASDTAEYALQALSNCSTLPGLWRSLYPAGYRFDIPTRFPTVFERYKKAEGCHICYLLLERTNVIAPPRVIWKTQRGRPDASEHSPLSLEDY